MEWLRQNVWWVIPPFVIASILGIVIGYLFAWLAYAAFNVLGSGCTAAATVRVGKSNEIL